MKKIKVLVFCLVFLSIPGLASAGAESGIYLGGSLGYTMIDFENIPVTGDDNDAGYKVFAGYNFGLVPFLDLAIEGSYVDFGEASAPYISNVDVGITALDAFGVVGFKMGPIGIFGKAGQVWYDTEASMFGDIFDRSSNDMAYGVGLRFQVGSASIRAEYEFFNIEIVDVNFFSVGVSWTF